MENVLKTQRDILIATQKKLDHAGLDKFGARNKRLIFAFGMVHKTEMSFARNSEKCILHVCSTVYLLILSQTTFGN